MDFAFGVLKSERDSKVLKYFLLKLTFQGIYLQSCTLLHHSESLLKIPDSRLVLLHLPCMGRCLISRSTICVAHHLSIELVCAADIDRIVTVAHISAIHDKVSRCVHPAAIVHVLTVAIRSNDCVLVFELAYELLQILVLHHRGVSDQVVRRCSSIIQ